MHERGSSDGHAPQARESLLGPRIVAGLLVAGGAFLIYHALEVGEVAGYTVVGPSTAPLFVSAALIVLGLVLAVRTTIAPDRDLAVLVAGEESATHWPTVGLLLLALVVYGLALNGFALGPIDVPGLGYVVATALLLPAAARILGSEHLVRDLVVGIGVAIVVYVGFTQFLGVRLPPGLLGIFG